MGYIEKSSRPERRCCTAARLHWIVFGLVRWVLGAGAVLLLVVHVDAAVEGPAAATIIGLTAF